MKRPVGAGNERTRPEQFVSLYVGNLFYGVLEEELAALFCQFGDVKEVVLAMDHDRGRFRGFGFVKLPRRAAESAIARLNGYDFQGRNLIVSIARTTDA